MGEAGCGRDCKYQPVTQPGPTPPGHPQRLLSPDTPGSLLRMEVSGPKVASRSSRSKHQVPQGATATPGSLYLRLSVEARPALRFPAVCVSRGPSTRAEPLPAPCLRLVPGAHVTLCSSLGCSGQWRTSPTARTQSAQSGHPFCCTENLALREAVPKALRRGHEASPRDTEPYKA